MTRTLPAAPEAEVCVLGAMLLDPSSVDTVTDLLRDGMFYRRDHQQVYDAITAIHRAGKVPDPPSVIEWLTDRGDLQRIGGASFIADLLDAVPTAANVAHHCDIVRDRWQRRQLIDAGTKIVQLAHEPAGKSGDELVDAAETLVFDCATDSVNGLVRLKDSMFNTFQRLEEIQGAPGGITGVATGFPALDDMTGGFQRGDLIIVGGRPSMGKTAVLTGVALHAALTVGVPVALFSFEMARDAVIRRMLCHEALVDLLAMMRGRLQDDDFGRLAQAAGHINEAPIWIEDRGNTVTAVRSKARRLAREMGELGLIVVDYLGMMRSPGAENRNHEMGELTMGLKELSKELDVPIVAGHQLSRAPATRSDPRPQLSDLRDSGNIEQDADLVMFVHRPEYYMTRNEAREKGVEGKAELLIRKQRNGPTGEVDLYFRKECARFEEARTRSSWGNR